MAVLSYMIFVCLLQAVNRGSLRLGCVHMAIATRRDAGQIMHFDRRRNKTDGAGCYSREIRHDGPPAMHKSRCSRWQVVLDFVRSRGLKGRGAKGVEKMREGKGLDRPSMWLWKLGSCRPHRCS
ncbi:hypothetical protein F5X68DRAFT_201654 [Plectosphaerella plurivora]|uniref:Secreted protein n=1 Tax=Plectosphaerella plurivora TaxID=936078 RepID=A0A9P8VGM7_9PEZI|nr:hypothetical protein F5X68DRAFT_201654 [Plectosphaerella plurivora]